MLRTSSNGKKTRVRRNMMFVSEYCFSKCLGKVEDPRKPHHKMGTAALSSSLERKCCATCCSFSLAIHVGCGAGSAYQHSDVRVQLSNEHYAVTTSIACKLFCPGETSVIYVEGKSREISSFHYSPLKGNGKQHRISLFIGCVEVLAFNNIFLRLFIQSICHYPYQFIPFVCFR